jgi:hypothetical protein
VTSVFVIGTCQTNSGTTLVAKVRADPDILRTVEPIVIREEILDALQELAHNFNDTLIIDTLHIEQPA